MLGVVVRDLLVRYLGYTGATLALISALALGWSIFSGMSWISAAERLGALLELSCLGLRNQIERWQDRRIGREVAREREAVVEDEKRRVETHEPIFIETPKPAAALPVKVEKRIERERQVPLFPEAVAGGLLPPLHLLEPGSPQTDRVSAESLEYTSRLIERRLADFGVQARVLAAYPGPVITRYEIEPAVGVKGAQIVNLAKDLARALSMVSVRVVETVPGKSCMALELPNAKRQIVRLSEIISSAAYHDMGSPLAMTLGMDIGGNPVVVDLAKMPHLLVAGTTGSGKSVGLNAMILSLLYKSEPDKVRLILVDPKMLELSIYEGIPHLLAPVVVDMKHAANALFWCVGEMDKRYKLMSALGVRNIAGLNHRIKDAEKAGGKLSNPFSLTPEAPEQLVPMPNIVVVIDELADLMMVAGKKVEQLIARLAQKARAAGIHLILATQRPSVDVITGLIKANIPTRMSFQVSSKIDSRTILDQMGAEALLGQGDMLYLAPGTGYPTRVHGAFVADDEVHRVVDYLKRAGAPNYVEGVLSGAALDDDEEGGNGDDENGGDAESDPLYDQAVEIVMKNRRASISLVQRHLRIGYNRSARLIEAMEKAGLVSAMDGRGGREVIARKEGS
jgi:S-DNA-T family DNA segregation ATPase FtsK/SpoIIIE